VRVSRPLALVVFRELQLTAEEKRHRSVPVYNNNDDAVLLLAAEEEEIYRQAEMQARNMPLSVVRLSFRAYLYDSSGTTMMRVLPPVMSNPIFDSSMHIILHFCFSNSCFFQILYM